MIIAQKKNNNQVYTGFSNPGKCFYRGKKSVLGYNVCEKYERRDDIFSAEKLNLNKEEEKR